MVEAAGVESAALAAPPSSMASCTLPVGCFTVKVRLGP